MWRYRARRGAASPDALPATMHLQWVRQLPQPRPAWPATQSKLQFDVAPQPVVMGGRIFVPSSSTDSVTAYDTATGNELWRFYADGPVRFSPVAHNQKVYFTSDDGHLYCLAAKDGSELWKVNGGPAQRAILGNHRLISSWPARGGPVLHQGKIFFAASIWPFMGIFIHAVDAETGAIAWTNSGDGANWTVHPHNAPSFGGVVPQGHLVASGDNLIVPGGRSTPAVYDTRTGKLKYFEFDKKSGGHAVAAGTHTYYVAGKSYKLSSGAMVEGSAPDVFDDHLMVHSNGDTIRLSSADLEVREKEVVDRRGKAAKVNQIVRRNLGALRLTGGPTRLLMKAGNRIYTGAKGKVAAFVLKENPEAGAKLQPDWTASIDGEPVEMLAASDRLFVVTADARMYCFGAGKTTPTHHTPAARAAPAGKAWRDKAKQILSADTTAGEGFAVVMGLGDGQLVQALIEESKLHLIVVDNNARKVDAFRRTMQARGVYGWRVAAVKADPATYEFPDYLANLITTGDASFEVSAGVASLLFQPLRPYGGLACLPLSEQQHELFLKQVRDAALPNAVVRRHGGYTILQRAGALKGAGAWTHQYGNAAQTVVSKDSLVKAPVGLLWFGGPSHAGILPRHGHGPSPQVAGGRLVIEGPDMLRAVDVYTGRVMWETEMKDLGKYYNKTSHFSGAGEIGSNYVTLPENIYAVYGPEIRKLDAASGAHTRSFRMKDGASFGHISVSGDVLIATASPLGVSAKKGGTPSTRYAAGSKRLVAFDRQSGALLWKRDAAFNFRHNNIALSPDKVFCIDSMTSARLKLLARRGIDPDGKPILYALDIRSGEIIWSEDKNVQGTFLNYSETHDALIQAGSAYRDRAKDEAGAGVIAYRGSDGEVLWNQSKLKHGGPCLLWRDKIITNGGGGFALDLKTGEPTGWNYKRMYGCNTAVGSEHLLTFRSGAAGFYDLAGDSGTGNIGGFKSSCTSNLIVADGVLNAPDYTRS